MNKETLNQKDYTTKVRILVVADENDLKSYIPQYWNKYRWSDASKAHSFVYFENAKDVLDQRFTKLKEGKLIKIIR